MFSRLKQFQNSQRISSHRLFFLWKKTLEIFIKKSGYTQSTKMIDPTMGSFYPPIHNGPLPVVKWILEKQPLEMAL